MPTEIFDLPHSEYLSSQHRGRLAAVAPMEVRGDAEQVELESPLLPSTSRWIIRIHPRRVVSYVLVKHAGSWWLAAGQNTIMGAGRGAVTPDAIA